MPIALLVIEEPRLHRAYAQALQEASYVVMTHDHGHGLLEATVDLRPDVVIADADATGVSGYDLLDLLKHSHHLASTRVILLSPVVSAIDRQRTRELGAADMAISSPVAIGSVIRDLSHPPRHRV